LAEIWLRAAARLDRCVRPPPRSSEDKLFYIFVTDMPQVQPTIGTPAKLTDPNDK
jgi:hypothetical protein